MVNMQTGAQKQRYWLFWPGPAPANMGQRRPLRRQPRVEAPRSGSAVRGRREGRLRAGYLRPRQSSVL